MKKELPIEDDPVVQEVRAWRRQLWKDAGGTFAGLKALLDRTLPLSSRRKSASRSPVKGGKLQTRQSATKKGGRSS